MRACISGNTSTTLREFPAYICLPNSGLKAPWNRKAQIWAVPLQAAPVRMPVRSRDVEHRCQTAATTAAEGLESCRTRQVESQMCGCHFLSCDSFGSAMVNSFVVAPFPMESHGRPQQKRWSGGGGGGGGADTKLGVKSSFVWEFGVLLLQDWVPHFLVGHNGCFVFVLGKEEQYLSPLKTRGGNTWVKKHAGKKWQQAITASNFEPELRNPKA